MGFIETLNERKLLAQITHPDELTGHLESGKRTAYAGFDPTAESFHVGNLIPIMGLRRWQQAGHKVIVLMGGATAMIGDPSGKTELRQMLTLETIDHRIELLKKQFSRFLDLSSDAFGMIVNNGDWFRDMNYLTILREIGADFTVNRMLAAECFKQRYERGLSFLEFNYMILQSYDFLHLHRKYGCSVQLGGDDQWSNMLGGADLVRRKEQAQAFAVTLPLLTTSSGAKMGKTEKGAVWLDENMTSPFEFFQYFRSIEDDMVEKCLLYFTDVPVADVTAMTSKRDHSINEAKITLAFEITKLVHGVAEAERAKDMAAALFSGSSDAAPEVMIPMDRFSTGAPILDLLVETGICETKGEARRLIEQNGISFNDQKVTDPKQIVEHAVLMSEPVVKKGKKNFYKIKLV